VGYQVGENDLVGFFALLCEGGGLKKKDRQGKDRTQKFNTEDHTNRL
jgi:hypothetical protein